MFEALEVAADVAHLVGVVHLKVYFAVEDAVVGLDVEAAHVDVEFLGEHGGYGEEHADAVDAVDAQYGGEAQLAVGVPSGGQEVVAVGGLQSVGLGALAFVDGYVALAVYVAEDVVARDGLAAGADGYVGDGFLVEHEGLLLVDGE